MKRVLILTLAFLILFSFAGCSDDNSKTDEIAVPFVKAMLLRDNGGMSDYLHPDYKESALPDDKFYDSLSENHFFSAGNELDGLTAVDKNYVTDTGVDGTLMKCNYLIRTNELLYDVELMILENDNGYGIVAVSMKMNTEIDYFNGSNA